MIGHLYRYPHPHDLTRFIYVGQGSKRDREHRSGRSSFGRRFKRDFPNVELPQPIREQVGVESQLGLNELETIWMIQYHTWRGYPEGMNLTFPGTDEYKNGRLNVESGHLARIRARRTKEEMVETGKKRGRWAVTSGHIFRIRTSDSLSNGGKIGGKISGQQNVENGHLDRIRNLPQTKEAQIRVGSLLGRKAVENGLIKLLPTLSAKWSENNKEEASRNASVGGCKARDLKRGVHGLSAEDNVLNGRKAGTIASNSGQVQELGRKNAESGRLKQCLHIRWHVNRGLISSSSCSFCQSN